MAFTAQKREGAVALRYSQLLDYVAASCVHSHCSLTTPYVPRYVNQQPTPFRSSLLPFFRH